MGYACPVCDAEQPDGVHLANHLAVTASLGRSDHEAWLAEYAPGWGENDPDELADRVVAHAPEIDTPEFATEAGSRPETGFEAHLAAGSRHPGRGDPLAESSDAAPRDAVGGARTDEVESVLSEARELTERMRDDGTRAGEGRGEAGEDGSATDADEETDGASGDGSA